MKIQVEEVEYEFSEYFSGYLQDTNYDGQMEKLQERVTNIADAFAKLLKVLASKGSINEDDLVEIFNLWREVKIIRE